MAPQVDESTPRSTWSCNAPVSASRLESVLPEVLAYGFVVNALLAGLLIGPATGNGG